MTWLRYVSVHRLQAAVYNACVQLFKLKYSWHKSWWHHLFPSIHVSTRFFCCTLLAIYRPGSDVMSFTFLEWMLDLHGYKLQQLNCCTLPVTSVLSSILQGFDHCPEQKYIANILDVVEKHGVSSWQFIRNTKIYGFCKPSESFNLHCRLSN